MDEPKPTTPMLAGTGSSLMLPLTPGTNRSDGPAENLKVITMDTPPDKRHSHTPRTPKSNADLGLAPACAARRDRPQLNPNHAQTPDPGAFLRDRVKHYQQPRTAEGQLSRLVHLCRQIEITSSSDRRTMAEALLGLAPSNVLDATNTKFPVSHVDQLQSQLKTILESKTSATRSEHVSISFDIRPTVQFTIIEGGNDASAQIDPALGPGAGDAPDTQSTRLVRVHEAVLNQPQDDPATQRSVSKHIVGLLSAVDGSSWVVRDITRGAQGWTFIYICKDSAASWARQNAKNPAKAPIGEYSLKELDAQTTGRPAFDCRGSVSIAFSKSSRSINIKYDHTPFHKTVGQLIEHFRPPPRPVPEPPVEPADSQKKTPRKRKSTAAAGDGREGDGSEEPKKAPRKRKSEAAGTAEGGQPPKRRKKKSDTNQAPEAAMGDASGTNGVATAQTRADHAVESGVHAGTVLNVPPAEAARRRETAIRLLSDSGLDPESLSADQFAIFANQSPDLQKESLAMLVQYGAERLRIVHPKDSAPGSGTGSADGTPSQPPQLDTVPAVDEEEAPTLSAGKKRARKSKGGANDSPRTGPKVAKPQISRGACSLCRGKKTKCDKAKPSCGPCQKAGLDCQYPLEKSREPKLGGGSSRKSAAAIEDEDEEEEEPPAEEVTAPARPEPQPEPDQEPDDIETIDYTSNMPVANMLTPAVDSSSHHDYFTNTGFPPAPMQNEEVHGVAPSSLNYPEPPSAMAAASYSDQQSVVTYGQAPAQAESPRARHKKSRSTGRHALPGDATPNYPAATVTESTPSFTTGWQAASTQNTRRNARSPPASQPTTGRQQTAVSEAQATYSAINNMQTLTNAALQQQSVSPTVQPAQTVTPSQQSPFQASAQVSRSKSRASQRAQTRTPLGDKRTSTPSHRTVQQNVPAAAPPAVDTPTYGSTVNVADSSNHNAYGLRYSGNPAAQESNRLSYEPYVAQNASTSHSSYQPQSSYSNRSSTTASRNPQPPQQQAATSSSYSSATTGSHGRKTPAHSTSMSTAPTSSYADPMAISNRQTASLQSFNMRSASSSSQTRNASGYAQQDKSYGDYGATQASTGRQQQAQQAQQPQQQGTQQGTQQAWYGGFTAANAPSTYGNRTAAGYSGSSGDGGSYQQQQQQQHHGQMNMSGHGYGGGESDYFDLLRSMNQR